MILRGFLLICLGFSLSGTQALLGMPITIRGVSSEYAGRELHLCRYTEYITLSEEVLGKTTVAADGSFSLQAGLARTSLVFFHLGRDFVYLYAEPGKEYQVSLPKYRELTPGDLLNPYFREDELMMECLHADSMDLNAVISRFDEAYGPIFANYAKDYQSRINLHYVDSVVRQLKARFATCTHPYFQHYLSYKTGILLNTALQFRSRNAWTPYFIKQPVLASDPVYMEFFHRVFDAYFNRPVPGEKGAGSSSALSALSGYPALDALLRRDSLLSNDSLRNLVILKNVHDEFFRSHYSRNALLSILDSMIAGCAQQDARITALAIRKKVVRLLPGFDPPAFELPDRNGIPVSLASLKGKYIYLGFCNCFSYSCLKEYEMLKHLQKKLGDRFTILSISVDPDLQKMQEFLAQNEYAWLFLNAGKQPVVLKDYAVRTFPTYFVIGPDGKLLLSPAPGPGENFESIMFQLMRSRGVL